MRIKGIADIIREESEGRNRQELAFKIVQRICEDEKLAKSIEANTIKDRIEMSARIGLAVLTEGVLVAPTEGIQGIEIHKNPDGSDYAAILYAGPIRSAGGTSAALSVSLVDVARRSLGIGAYKAQQSEIERYIEEIQIYNAHAARLQYLPNEADIRTILQNCPVCVDGLPTEEFEVNLHRDIERFDHTGKKEIITNRIRGGVCLVLCEGIAQKSKNVLKYTKNSGLDWNWLNNIIKVEKVSSSNKEEAEEAVFLHEQVAGRPIFAYPNYPGAFRMRYGRSRFTGIASKGFNPATIILLRFIAVGTQIKIEKPGKGCIAMPVDSIEGPFVKLKSGEAFRINSIGKAQENMHNISKILSVGDILITYGDFRKTNTKLVPTSYVEEYWERELENSGYSENIPEVNSFEKAYEISKKYSIPLHPLYTYEYQDLQDYQLPILCDCIKKASLSTEGEEIFKLKSIRFEEDVTSVRGILELMCIPHKDNGDHILVSGDDAQSLLTTFGFIQSGNIDLSINPKITGEGDALKLINNVSPFKVMRRSYRIGGRMGRPEKARERLMKPSPHLLFPIGEYGGKERNISKAYSTDSRRFKSKGIDIDVAKFRCNIGKEYVISGFCSVHNCSAKLERYCKKCGIKTIKRKCDKCDITTTANEIRNFSLIKQINSSLKNLNMITLPKSIKGVKGLVSKDRISEPLEKGILRSLHSIYVFKDGTCRFDATDAPITHFYPKEIGTSVEKLIQLGYSTDYKGNSLTKDDQLVELMHQDVIINKEGGEYLFRVSKFIDDLLSKHYKMEPFYNMQHAKGMVGQYVITLAPHISAGVLGRIIGFTNAKVGLCHPYLISARRRNCDGDEDTTMLLLDALINFSRNYLPSTVGGTMDAPLILTVNVKPDEVDDEVHEMEVVSKYPLEFYEATMKRVPAGAVTIENVKSRIKRDTAFKNLLFSHSSSIEATEKSPNRSVYTQMKSMDEKVSEQFKLMDILSSIDKRDTAKKLITGHFIPDLMGNLHSFSKQKFRCVSCNAKYRRIPLMGKCDKCGGKLLLTISKGGIEKYLNISESLLERYDIETYIKQRVLLLKNEIDIIFGKDSELNTKQFNLGKFL